MKRGGKRENIGKKRDTRGKKGENEGKPKLKKWVGEENQHPGSIYTPVSYYISMLLRFYLSSIYLSIYQSRW